MLILSSLAFAVPGRTTYQAKIIKPNGYPLESSYVNFRFTVLDPAASCAIYVEDYTGINMTSSGGMISFALGAGVVSFPASATATTFATTFDNSVNSFSCQTPGIYNPSPTDARKIVMQFNDGSGWQTLPAMTINAVPYAMYASKSFDSKSLNGKSDAAFVEKINVPTCASDRMLYFNGASFSCMTYSAGSTGISSVTTSGSVLVTGGSASAPVISITAATMSQDGYLTAIDYAEFKSKLSTSATQIVSTLGYAPVSGAAALAQIEASATSSATADTLVKRNSSGNVTFNDVYANAAKINYVDIYRPSTSFNIRLQAPTSLSSNYILNLPTTSGTTGQVLATDGLGNLSWISAATGSVTSVSGAANEILSSGGSTPTLSLANAGTAGTYFKVTTDSKGRVTSGVTSIALIDLPASVLNTTSNFSGDISGMISNITVNRIQGVSVTVSSLSNNDILQYDGSKYVNKNIPSCSGNYYLTFNGTNFSCALDAGSSGTITTLSVTGPISSTGGANPTLSMAQADASTNGYLSSADFNTFNNKQNATSAAIIATLGYTPANNSASGTYAQKANNLSDLTSISSARSNLGLGSLAVGNSVDLGSASATGIIADARLANQTSVTSGTQYTKVTVDSKGRVTSGAQLSSSDVTTALGYTPSNSTSGVTSLNGLVTQTQTFSVGVAGTNFGINSSGSNHTFNIPLAASSSVTAGLLSNADYTIFNNKQNATSAAIIATLGYTPADSAASGTYAQKANNLSDLTNIITARTNLGLGSLAVGNSVDLGSASATGIIADARLANQTSVASGTQYTKVTVDGKGRVTIGAQLASTDVTTALGYTPADNAASGTYAQKANNLSDLTNIITARTNLGLGSLAVGNSVDLGSASATGTIAIARLPAFFGDATIAAASNTIIFSNTGVTAGTYTKVSVDSKGRVTSSSALSSADVTTALGYTPSNSTSGVTSLNGLVTQTQTFSVGVAGINFGINSSGSNHTFNIPLAASSSVTAGLLSNADYLVFNNKITSSSAAIAQVLGYTPADNAAAGNYLQKANNLSDLTNIITARTNLGLGSLAVGNSIDLGSASATGTLAIARLPAFFGDASIAAASNTIIFSNTGVTAGTYTKLTVDSKGRVTSGAQLASTDVTTALGYTPADNAVSGTYAQKANNLSDLTNIITARTNLGLGSLAVGNSVDLGSASATGTIAIARLPAFFGDATVAAASNTIIFSNTGVTAGTYTKVSVDSKGRVTSSAALSSSDVTTALGYTPANAISATQWVSSGTAISYNSGAVGIGALEPSTSAVLEVSSTTKGFLPPRLTSVQRDAVPTPVMGLMIFNTTSSQFEFYTGSSWAVVGGIAAGAIAAFETATCPNGWAEYTAARGRFLRAIDNGAGIDPSGTRAPGSAQTENWRGFSMTNTGQNTTAYSHGPVDMGKSTSTFVGNMFTGAWSAPAAAIGLRWNASDETRPTNIAVTYCRFLGGTGSPPVGANQISQIDSSVTVADAGSGTISLAIDGVERVRVQPTGNVGIGTTTPAAKLEVEGSFIRTIARASGNFNDVADSGQITTRVLNVTKLKASTSLRIGWTDSRRALNGGCRWEIRVNGASCPGAALTYDLHSANGSDPHISGHIVGYCDGLSAGNHQIQIWVSSTPGYTGIDCYTGWSGSRWMLESEEVN